MHASNATQIPPESFHKSQDLYQAPHQIIYTPPQSFYQVPSCYSQSHAKAQVQVPQYTYAHSQSAFLPQIPPLPQTQAPILPQSSYTTTPASPEPASESLKLKPKAKEEGKE